MRSSPRTTSRHSLTRPGDSVELRLGADACHVPLAAAESAAAGDRAFARDLENPRLAPIVELGAAPVAQLEVVEGSLAVGRDPGRVDAHAGRRERRGERVQET